VWGNAPRNPCSTARHAAVRALQVAGNAAARPLRPAKMCNLFLRGPLVQFAAFLAILVTNAFLEIPF
jgi:hypothetical protein